jgi:hypothetical protein
VSPFGDKLLGMYYDVIERIEELEDRVRVHLFYRNGVGIPDEHDTVEVAYQDILSLPPGSGAADTRRTCFCLPAGILVRRC